MISPSTSGFHFSQALSVLMDNCVVEKVNRKSVTEDRRNALLPNFFKTFKMLPFRIQCQNYNTTEVNASNLHFP